MHRISECFPVVYSIFVVVITSAITREQLVKILDEKLAPFKQTISDLKKSVDEANKFAKFASKQYDDMLKKVAAFEEDHSVEESTNDIAKKVGNLLGVKIEDREISISHRIPNTKNLECANSRSLGQPLLL